MKLSIPLLLLLGAIAAPATSFGQEIAGRVLVSVGDVTIVRKDQRIAAKLGTEVRSGDTLELGVQSNAQIGLTDESIIALRPETTFQITEYAFAGQTPETQNAFFKLIKGGLRTITGIVGKIKQANYKVVTPTVVIGIRGTNYSLVECNDSCRNPNGSLAPNGTYGAVTNGRIGVINQTGERQFGSDQYFHVASQTTAPQQLIAPPSFLRDTLEGRARAQKQQQQAGSGQQQQSQGTKQAGAASGGTESTGAIVAQTGQGVSGSAAGSTTVPAVLATNVFTSTQNFATQGPAAILQPTATGTVAYRLESGALNIPIACSNPPCSSIVKGDIILGVNFTAQRAFISVAVIDIDKLTNRSEQFNFSTPLNSDGFPITVSGGQIKFSGTVNRADFPTQQGAFRCSDCAIGGGPGFLDSIGASGVISGATATMTLFGTSADGESGSFNVTLTQQAPPNNSAAAMVLPVAKGGAQARSAAYWNVGLDASGQLLHFGTLGANVADVGTATNTIAGSAPDAGNLVWGKWVGPGAAITDNNYVSFVTASGSVQPWITGDVTNTLPPSLGSKVSYTPVGSLINNGTGVLNSALLTADFINRAMIINLNATNPGAGNTFQMNGSSGISSANARFSAGFTTVTCTGPCVGGTPGGSFGGFFAGANAQGAGVAFTAGFGLGTGVSGVVGFKR